MAGGARFETVLIFRGGWASLWDFFEFSGGRSFGGFEGTEILVFLPMGGPVGCTSHSG